MNFALDQIDDALKQLAADVLPGPLFEARRVLDQLTYLNGEIFEAANKTGNYRGNSIGSELVPGRRAWEELVLLLGVTLQRTPRLRCWYQLGRSLAESLLAIQQREAKFVPGLAGVITAVTKLPQSVVKRNDLLERLAKEASNRRKAKATKVLHRGPHLSRSRR